MSDPSRRWRHVLVASSTLLCALFLFASTVFAAESLPRTERNQDIVFLVDISSSMQDIFGDVKASIREYVGQARTGDNMVLISFGERVELRIRTDVDSEEDLKRIERELANLEPTDYFTDIVGALDKGMEELRLLEKNYPDHLKTMVLMSDGKNNPSKAIADPMTFEEISEKYPSLLQDDESRFFYLSLGDDPDAQVLSFMETVEGSSFDMGKGVRELTGSAEQKQQITFAQVFVEPVALDIGTIPGPKGKATVSLAFLPARGNPAGKIITLAASARFQSNPSWKTIIEVVPKAIQCSSTAWSRNIVINVDSLHEGTIIGTLELKPLPGQVLFLDPPEIPITMTIGQPGMQVMQEPRLVFGPVYPGSQFQETQTVPLMPNAAAANETIRADPGIVLPEGMKLAAKVERRADMHELMVTVSTDEDFHASHSTTIEGSIHLFGAEHAVSFSEEYIEVSIEVAPTAARSRPITDILGGLFSRYGKTVGYILIPVLLLLIAGSGVYWWLVMRPESGLEGTLVLIHLKGRRPDKSKLVKVNLHTIGKSLGRDSLIIGSAKDAGLTLPHKTVAVNHCEIRARIEKGNKRILIQSIGKNSVIVNLQKIREATPLSDRDLLEIGAYTFRFENPHPYKQIVVRRLDGRILKGTPATWDIDSDGFNLLPRDALPGSDEEIFIPFADLKAIYFVRDFDGRIGKKIVSPASQIQGIHMRLTFHDGEEMEGYTSENYNQSSPRFYFFPLDQTGNTISMVVERANLRKLDIIRGSERSAADTITIDTIDILNPSKDRPHQE